MGSCNHVKCTIMQFYVFIHYTGATYIKKLLIKNEKIECIKLGGNTIGDDGVRHVTKGLQQNNTLNELRLCSCEITVRGT